MVPLENNRGALKASVTGGIQSRTNVNGLQKNNDDNMS